MTKITYEFFFIFMCVWCCPSLVFSFLSCVSLLGAFHSRFTLVFVLPLFGVVMCFTVF